MAETHPDDPFLRRTTPEESKAADTSRPPRPGTKEWRAYLKALNEQPVQKEGDIERITFGDPGKMRKA